jgi:assimilatory nitrate reductase catalytic subunit
MHWSDAFSSGGPVQQVVHGRSDPQSGQPDLKATPARLAPFAARLHGLLLRVTGGSLPPPWQWLRVPLHGGHGYRLALPADADAWTREQAAALLPAAPQMLEMADARRGALRLAALDGDRLVACLFLSPDPARLPAMTALAPLLGTVLAPRQRATLLSGQVGATTDEGPRVCTCFAVGRTAIRHAIVTHRLRDTAAIGAHLRAGTNCGSCLPELREILRDVTEPA